MSATEDIPAGRGPLGDADVFRGAFEAISEPAFLWRRGDDDSLRLAAANPAAGRFTRHAVEEILGQYAELLFARTPQVWEQIRRTLMTGQSCRLEVHTSFELQQEEHLLRIDLAKLGPDHVLCTITDLTERRQTELALHASEHAQRDMTSKLQALLEINLELTDTPSPRDLCRRAVEQARARLGYERMGIWFAADEPGVFTGSIGVDEHGNLRDEWHCRIDQRVDALMRRSLAERQSFGLRDLDTLRDDSGNPVGEGARAVAPLRDGQRVIGFVTVDNFLSGRPITPNQGELLKLFALSLGHQWARKQAEEQLRQSQKMEAIGRLAGGIAHDFNNQLTVVMGYCQMLLRDLKPTNPLHVPLTEIYNAAHRSHQLTSQLLSFSRRQVLNPEVLNLSAVMSKMLEPLGRMIGERITLSTDLTDEAANVRVDRAQLEQAVMNLVINARDAMPDGGRLELRVANVVPDGEFRRRHPELARAPHVLLSVRDTGAGIDEQALPHVFDPFFTTKDVGKGTGLGLSMVYGFIRQSNGVIDVESRLGQGATFRIFLPAAETAAAETPPPAASPRPKGDETILLVEDDQAVRTLIVRVLTQCGYAVLEAADGQEGMRLGTSHPGQIDLLVTDLVLPGLHGSELAERLKAVRPKLKVLRITGYTGPTTTRRGEPVLLKPVTPDTLAQRVRQVLDAP